MFLLISAHSTATPGIPVSLCILQSARIARRPQLSCEFSRTTRQTTYELFTPSNSGQRSHPTYYRGCWHVVGRCFFYTTVTFTRNLRPIERVYNPKAVIPHAASLHQAFAHCAIFPTAASRRSLGRISVPVWPDTLSDQLPVVALVGHYPTNKLMGRGPIPHRKTFHQTMQTSGSHPVLAQFPRLSPRCRADHHVLLTRSPLVYPGRALPFDLHVLSTPPAFVLSQDQTLQTKPHQKPRQIRIRKLDQTKRQQTGIKNPTPRQS